MINGKTQTYLYDGADIIQELGTVNSVYTHSAGVDEPLMRRGTTIEFYQADRLGSIIGLMNNSRTSTTSYAYSPYGLKQTAGIASSNPYAFTGREDDGTGLYFYRARYYSPSQKRLIAEDPLEFGGGDSNFYSYVGGNPVNNTGPFGLKFLTLSDLLKIVTQNNLSGQSNSLIICIAFRETGTGGKNESDARFDAEVDNPSSTAKGLLQMTRGAVKDVGYNYYDLADPNTNVRAGSKYIGLRIR